MAKHSKRYNDIKQKIEKDRVFTLEEAVDFIKENTQTKFDESVELHFNLGIDPRKGDQQVRSTMRLPHGTGKTKKVVVFAEGEAAQEAEKAGADAVGSEELIEEIRLAGKCDFDEAIATPDMMKKLGKIAKILGIKGIMPNPKKDTVTPNVAKAIADVKGGKIAFKNDETSNVHQLVGKVSFSKEQLMENIEAFVNALQKARPEGQKGTYIKSFTVTTTMGPGLTVEVQK